MHLLVCAGTAGFASVPPSTGLLHILLLQAPSKVWRRHWAAKQCFMTRDVSLRIPASRQMDLCNVNWFIILHKPGPYFLHPRSAWTKHFQIVWSILGFWDFSSDACSRFLIRCQWVYYRNNSGKTIWQEVTKRVWDHRSWQQRDQTINLHKRTIWHNPTQRSINSLMRDTDFLALVNWRVHQHRPHRSTNSHHLSIVC